MGTNKLCESVLFIICDGSFCQLDTNLDMSGKGNLTIEKISLSFRQIYGVLPWLVVVVGGLRPL